jgi:FkbM family methyltransferase
LLLQDPLFQVRIFFMRTLKAITKQVLPTWIVEKLKFIVFRDHSTKSYSQEGEDMILKRIFGDERNGFYVDIGAHHPKRFSNTYYFYTKGWRGINIDAMPGSMKAFNKCRPDDINIEVPISRIKQTLTYYMFNEPALNGFSKDLSEQRSTNGQVYKIIRTIDLETFTLSEILTKYLENGQQIDFMSIDVEGLDYDVLLSNDWVQFRPKIILVEMLNRALKDLYNHEITKLLSSKGYEITSKTMNTVFFTLEDSR